MTRKILVILTVAMLAATVIGCATNPITGRSQAMLVSDAEAAQQSALAYNQLLSAAAQKKVLDEDPAAVIRVQSIARPIIAQAMETRPETRGWQWDIHVLRRDEVNAWCMAGGKIAVYAGLLDTIRPTDDELAQVLAHEIAHALLSHQAEKLSRARLQKVGLGVGVLAGAVAGYDLRGVAGVAETVATVGLQLPNSREAESEADHVGIELAARAGFDPEAAVSLWRKMIQSQGARNPEWLSTHPNPETRIRAMNARAEELAPVFQAARRQR